MDRQKPKYLSIDDYQVLYRGPYWLFRAAEQGHRDAQLELADSFAKGINGLPVNNDKATYWREKAQQSQIPTVPKYDIPKPEVRQPDQVTTVLSRVVSQLEKQSVPSNIGRPVAQPVQQQPRPVAQPVQQQPRPVAQPVQQSAPKVTPVILPQPVITPGSFEDVDLSQTTDDLRATANSGNALAQALLGERYQYGITLPRDHKLAFSWYSKSADQNNPRGLLRLGKAYKDAIGVEEDEETAFDYVEKAANMGYANAELELARYYLEGVAVKESKRQAVIWAEKAIAHESIAAIAFLAERYFLGEGVLKDTSKAIDLFSKAANLGDSYAQFKMGEFHSSNASPLERSDELAVKWFKKSAAQGNREAENMLGFYYTYGKAGLPKDVAKGRMYFRNAALKGNTFAKATLKKVFNEEV